MKNLYEKKRLVNFIVNVSNEQDLYMYEQETGRMIHADKRDIGDIFPLKTYHSATGEVICKLISKIQFTRLIAFCTDLPLEDFGIIESVSPGRHGRPVAKVSWAKDPEVEVLFCPSAIEHSVSHHF